MLLDKTVWKHEKQYFEAIFGSISKFDLNLDSVGVSSSKYANKGNSIWQILCIGLKKSKIMIFWSFLKSEIFLAFSNQMAKIRLPCSWLHLFKL